MFAWDELQEPARGKRGSGSLSKPPLHLGLSWGPGRDGAWLTKHLALTSDLDLAPIPAHSVAGTGAPSARVEMMHLNMSHAAPAKCSAPATVSTPIPQVPGERWREGKLRLQGAWPPPFGIKLLDPLRSRLARAKLVT